MKLLKEMVENMMNENETEAKVNFHSYLTNKMQNLNEDLATKLDEKSMNSDNSHK